MRETHIEDMPRNIEYTLPIPFMAPTTIAPTLIATLCHPSDETASTRGRLVFTASGWIRMKCMTEGFVVAHKLTMTTSVKDRDCSIRNRVEAAAQVWAHRNRPGTVARVIAKTSSGTVFHPRLLEYLLVPKCATNKMGIAPWRTDLALDPNAHIVAAIPQMCENCERFDHEMLPAIPETTPTTDESGGPSSSDTSNADTSNSDTPSSAVAESITRVRRLSREEVAMLESMAYDNDKFDLHEVSTRVGVNMFDAIGKDTGVRNAIHQANSECEAENRSHDLARSTRLVAESIIVYANGPLDEADDTESPPSDSLDGEIDLARVMHEDDDARQASDDARDQAQAVTIKPIFVRIEGNVGCGKSTLLHHLSERLRGVHIVPEPVQGWTEHLRGVYGAHGAEDAHLWKWPMQALSASTRTESVIRALRSCANDPCASIVVERSDHSAKVFGELTLSGDDLTSFNVLAERYDRIMERWTSGYAEVSIYLRATPDTCAKRVSTRARDGEGGIDREFLEALHIAHDTAFQGADCTIDCDTDSSDVVADKVMQFLNDVRHEKVDEVDE